MGEVGVDEMFGAPSYLCTVQQTATISEAAGIVQAEVFAGSQQARCMLIDKFANRQCAVNSNYTQRFDSRKVPVMQAGSTP